MTDGGTAGEAAATSTAASAGAATARFTGGDAGPAAGQTELSPEQDHSRYRQLRDKLQAELNTRAEKMATDPDLDEGTRHRSLNDLWNAYTEGEMKIGQLYEKELQEAVETQEKRVFFTPRDLKDSVRSSYHMIEGEVDLAGMEGEGFEGIQAGHEKLEQMYDRASRTQDRALMLAIYQYAVERGLHSLRDRHLSNSPELSKAWEGFTAARMKLDNWNSREENLIQRLDGRRGIVKPPVIR